MSSTCQCPCWKDPARNYTRSELANHVPNWKHWCDTMWVFYKDFCHIRKHAEQPAKFKKHNWNKKRTVKVKTKNHDVASVTSWYCSLSSWKSIVFFPSPRRNSSTTGSIRWGSWRPVATTDRALGWGQPDPKAGHCPRVTENNSSWALPLHAMAQARHLNDYQSLGAAWTSKKQLIEYILVESSSNESHKSQYAFTCVSWILSLRHSKWWILYWNRNKVDSCWAVPLLYIQNT